MGDVPVKQARPIILKVTAGNVSDISMAEALLAEVDHCRYVLADKGYDSDKLRSVIHGKGAKPVIPGRKSRKRKSNPPTSSHGHAGDAHIKPMHGALI